jgi:hypothetical protein
MQKGFAAGELYTAQTQRPGFANNHFEVLNRQSGIPTGVAIKPGSYPAMATAKITSLCQIEVNLVQRICWLFGRIFILFVHSL